MADIKDPKITEAETIMPELEDPVDSVELKYRSELHRFQLIGRYVTFVLATVAIVVLFCRYNHLINGYEKVINLYLSNNDWQIIVIYALSLAFTGGLFISGIALMISLVKKKKKAK